MPTTNIIRTHSDEFGFTNNSYTVGWICALQTELAVSQAMLDEEHPDLQAAENDTNTYTLGRIEQHNVVLACLPTGTTGISAAPGYHSFSFVFVTYWQDIYIEPLAVCVCW
jgi:hypothetical protein